MTWRTLVTSDTLALTGALQTVQESAADMELELASFEEAHVQFEFNPQTTPTEVCEIIVQGATEDISGTPNWDTDNEPFMRILVGNTVDPSLRSVVLRGLRAIRFRAQLLDSDGTAGGDDTGDLIIRIRRNNVDAAQS